MRIAALTTDTAHHRYWAWRLAEAGLLGTRRARDATGANAPFETHHPFEDERDAYEREALAAPAWSDAGAGARGRLGRRRAASDGDLAVSFGTGLIGPELIAAWSGRLLNLHGGDPEHYAGWTRTCGPSTTAISTASSRRSTRSTKDSTRARSSAARRFPLPDALHELRAAQHRGVRRVDACRPRATAPPAVPQRKRGRYYSFMPAVLKDVCVRRWSKRTVAA